MFDTEMPHHNHVPFDSENITELKNIRNILKHPSAFEAGDIDYCVQGLNRVIMNLMNENTK